MDDENKVTQGPLHDHNTTSATGKFAYVSVADMNVGDVASFTTGPSSLPASTDVCTVRFWHFISGEPDIFLVFLGNRNCSEIVVMLRKTNERCREGRLMSKRSGAKPKNLLS